MELYSAAGECQGCQGEASDGRKGTGAAMMRLTGEREQVAGEENPFSETAPLLLTGIIRDEPAGGSGTNWAPTTVFGAGSSRRDNGRVFTTLLVLNYMIGAGILNAPQVFDDSGIGIATSLYVISAVATWLGIIVLVVAAELVYHPRGYVRAPGVAGTRIGIVSDRVNLPDASAGVYDRGRLPDMEFAQLAEETLGPYGSLSVNVSNVVQCFGNMASYVILIGSLTESLVEEWVGTAASGAWWSSFSFLAPLMIVLFVLPPSLIRHLSNLRWLAVFSFCAILSVVMLVVLAASAYAAYERSSPGHDPGLDAELTWWDWKGSVAKLGSIVFAVSYSPAALHAYTSMKPRNATTWRHVTSWTVGIGFTMCYLMGLSGYLAFRDDVNGNILSNINGPVASVFKAIVVVHLCIYIPSEVLVLRHSLYSLNGRDVMNAPFSQVGLVTAGTLALAVVVVVALVVSGIAQGDLFGYIIDITGGVAISATSFVLPGLIYLGVTSDEGLIFAGDDGGRPHHVYRRACKVLVVFGVLVMIVVPLGVVADIAGW